MTNDPEETKAEQVALKFAVALVDGRFNDAHALLSKYLLGILRPTDLETGLHQMYQGYAEGPPLPECTQVVSMTDIPHVEWRPGDLGWVYVMIGGEDFSEAVSVLVSTENEQFVIREIEWGRP